MTLGTVRLQAVADITGRPKESIRNMQAQGIAPWPDDADRDVAQRRYDGTMALALVLVDTLMDQGCSLQVAGECVRNHSAVISLFLDEVENHQPVTPRFLAYIAHAVEDSLTGTAWVPVMVAGASGTEDELMGIIGAELAGAGKLTATRDGRTTRRHLGGLRIASMSIPEAYRLLRMRAKAEGYVVDGRAILKLSDKREGGED